MEVVLLILFCIALVVVIFLIIRGLWNTHVIVNQFKSCNVIVCGKKGTGKDLLFQLIIYKRRREKYHANIDYGYNYQHCSIGDLNLNPNTYRDFISEDIKKIKKLHDDKEDCYISDGGVYLPSQYDSLLHKLYPSFPIYYALSRHTYLQNIHVNTQNLGRIWLAIREQADYYIVCKKVTKIFGLFIIHYITYDKYESAKMNLLPMGNRLFNKFSKAEQDQFKATNGEIKKRYSFILKKHIKYDTRAFANLIFDNIDPITKQIIPTPIKQETAQSETASD